MDIETVKRFLEKQIVDCQLRDSPYSLFQSSAYRNVLGFIEGAQEEESRIQAEDPRR